MRHNPDFTSIELYQVYADYEDMINLTVEIFCSIAQEVCGTLTMPYGDHTIIFERLWYCYLICVLRSFVSPS